MSSSQECVAVLQRMLDDVRGIGRVCATNVIYAAGEQDQALTAAIDALQRRSTGIEALADSLEVFWNASLSATRPHNDPTANAVMAGMVEGFAAMASRLREHDLPPQPPIPSPFDICPKCRDEYAYCECPQPPTGEQTP